MRQIPSRLRRLDGALADLPLEEPMLLSELDGFLTGIVLCPEPIATAEWMQGIWGTDEGGVAPFEDPADVRWFADAVTAQHQAIVRDLQRGKPQPLFDIDERNGEVLWDYWLDGFAQAMDLRPDRWAAVAESDDVEAAEAMADLALLIAVADDASDLDSQQINALQDRAPAMIVAALLALRATAAASQAPQPAVAARVGRNDPCPCGSGKKSKRCCLA